MRERLALGFGIVDVPLRGARRPRLDRRRPAGKRIATSFPNLVRKDLAAKGIEATVIRLDGAVEISVQLGVADAIADVVGSGRTLGLHDLVAFGDPLCDSEAVLIDARRRRRELPRPVTNWPRAYRVWCSGSSI